MTDIKLFNSALKFLLSFDNINRNDLDIHMESQFSKPNNIKTIYRLLCESAQNKQMSSKVIGHSIGGIENLGKVLYQFDPHKVTKIYKKDDSPKLLENIKKILKPRGQIRATTRSLWPQFCQSIIDAAYFLNSFKNARDFYKWADYFATNEKAKPSLPLMISLEISGIGFPLACDFLKELGYLEYGKPDVHLKGIFKALKIIDPKQRSATKQDYDTLKAIDRIAKSNKVTPYAVDKVFWLIGSGNFYLTNKTIGRQKQNFINLMTKRI